MLKIILCGCCGRMGKAITELVSRTEGVEIAAGVDPAGACGQSFPVFADISLCNVKADVIIDFSHRSALNNILAFCRANATPAVLASTGYLPEDTAALEEAAKEVPLFRSANMSIGVAILTRLVREASSLFGDDFDVEIIERHHNKKLDAPSGTALHLAHAVKEGAESPKTEIYDRHAVRRERGKSEIGMHAVRGGTIIGEHEVLFAGWNETVSLSHSAQSREVFASGAVRAAAFMAGVTTPGIYGMDDIFADR